MKRKGNKPPLRLGIDLGTTRTVVAAADRGNYPVIGFAAPDGDLVEHYPSISAEVGGELVHGLEAEAAARKGAPSLRSWKRLLADRGAAAEVSIGTVRVGLLELVTDFLGALRRDLASRSNLPAELGDRPEAVISVPANAHSTQRFVTLEGFRQAGFAVRAMLNEPSAAGLEYAHRYRRTITSRREHVVIYDLGGGTFDSALVRMAGDDHDVLCTSGITRLGGDDVDEALLAMALERAGIEPELLASSIQAALLDECRTVKESIHPNTRRIVLDLAALGPRAPADPLVIAVSELYERVRSLVVRSVDALEPVLRCAADEGQGEPGETPLDAHVAGIYVVGGGSGLPLVPRVLRERFGRRVHRSVYPSAATAMGLAIAADAARKPPQLTERFTRHFGVFRELVSGARVSFDRVFEQGTPMPKPGEPPLVATRRYRAAHDIGVFRFVECAGVDEANEPSGDITPHASARFPFVAQYRERDGLADLPVERLPREGPLVEERYEVDPAGVIAVTIRDLEAGYERRYTL